MPPSWKTADPQGVVEPAPLCAALLRFRRSTSAVMGPRGAHRPGLADAGAAAAGGGGREPARLFERVCTLLTRIFTRSAYLQLLAENPAALRQLAAPV